MLGFLFIYSFIRKTIEFLNINLTYLINIHTSINLINFDVLINSCVIFQPIAYKFWKYEN